MEFTVDKRILQEAVQKTLGIVERKTTIPILSNILIKTDGDSLKIVATDREIGLVANYPAQIYEPGDITINAKKISEMIREMDDDSVLFRTVGDKQAFIKSGSAEYRVQGIPSDDFPEVHMEEEVECFSIPSVTLSRMIRKTFFAATADETRKSLNGAYFKKEGLNCEMVATDGYRMSLVTEVLPEANGKEIGIGGVIIPRKGLLEIRKIFGDKDMPVEMGITGNVLVVKTKDIMLRLSLIDATYPDYSRVIPKDRGVEIHLDRHRFLQSLRRMGVMATEFFSGVALELSDGKMILNSTNPDVGEANEEIEVSYKDGSFTIAYNVHYLIEGIESMDSELISLDMRRDGGPCVIRPLDDDSHVCIVMPLKIKTNW